MAKPRNPLGKAKIEGRDKKDPQRFKNRTDAKADGPLGNPPAWLKDTPELKAKAAWKLFEKELPWLNQSHRTLVGMAANIQGRIMAGEDVGVQKMNLLRQMLGQMGATPADASKVATGEDGDEKDDLLD
jgi:hypothetical protein